MSFTTPVEIDTEIARLSFELSKADAIIARYESADPESYIRPSTQERYDEAVVTFTRLREEIAPLQAAYTGWPRYYHVQNVGGHIHTSMSCSSCFPDTQFGWRTDLSGLTVEEVVAKEAYNACTVCMPIAPAEQKAAREYFNRQQREAKAAERQAKKDEKLKKAAERAVKFLAKVDKIIAENYGSWDKLFVEYSLYGHDGKKSYYDSSYDLPQQVADYIYDEMAAREHEHGTGFRHNKDPKATIAEAREKGLIA